MLLWFHNRMSEIFRFCFYTLCPHITISNAVSRRRRIIFTIKKKKETAVWRLFLNTFFFLFSNFQRYIFSYIYVTGKPQKCPCKTRTVHGTWTKHHVYNIISSTRNIMQHLFSEPIYSCYRVFFVQSTKNNILPEIKNMIIVRQFRHYNYKNKQYY